MREKLLTFTVTIPAPENFTGRVLVSVEKGTVLGSYVLRKNEFTTTVESFFESANMAGVQIIYPDNKSTLAEKMGKIGGIMPNQPQVYEIFDVVRRSDGMVMNHISSGNRYMVYTLNGLVSVRTLMADEIVGTPKLFELILERAGYRVTPVKKD